MGIFDDSPRRLAFYMNEPLVAVDVTQVLHPMTSEHEKPATRAERKRTLDAIGTVIRFTRRQIWFYGTLSILLFTIAFVLFP